jgi:ATP-dependent Clp protease ATP-binding subunit ClpA
LPEYKRKKVIGPKDIESVVATIARIPSQTVTRNDRAALRTLEDDLKRLVFDQDTAIEKLVASIKLSRAGLRDPQKPIGSYLFSGPTGVGKTEVARQLALTLGLELVRFDMSEYMERHSVSRLIGAPPGYVGYEQGGLLTDKIDQHPHCVLLLDEVEKAHPDLFNLLLQVMDYGKLTDTNGKTIDFRSTILIMTTNAGASDLARAPLGFMQDVRTGDDEVELKRLFTPEFRNRLDAIIPFTVLKPATVVRVVEKFILELEAMLAPRNITMSIDDAAKSYLAHKGYDPLMGARPLARLIESQIKQPLADELLFGHLQQGGHVTIGFNGEQLTFSYGDLALLPKPSIKLLPEPDHTPTEMP